MSTLEALRCPSCNATLREEDLDEARGIAKCSYCRALLTLPAARTDGAGCRPRGEVPLPARITVDSTIAGVEIRRRWFSPMFVFLIFFCVAWNAFLIFWYSMAFANDAPWIFKWFPIAHLAVGVWLTYFTLAGFMNTTRIRVENGRLSVVHGPLPWRGNRELDADDIAQLYCKEHIQRGENGPQTSFEVWLVRKDKTSLKLLDAGFDSDQALFLEQRIEQALSLKDWPVPGEMSR